MTTTPGRKAIAEVVAARLRQGDTTGMIVGDLLTVLAAVIGDEPDSEERRRHLRVAATLPDTVAHQVEKWTQEHQAALIGRKVAQARKST